jgi:ferredoxin
MQILPLISITAGCILFLLLICFGWISWREEEPRATRRAFVLALLLPLPYLATGLIDSTIQMELCITLVSITIVIPVILIIPMGNRFPAEDDTPGARIDERNIMFSRKLLEEGSQRFEEYYRIHPENKAPDELFRTYPGLLKKGAFYYDPVTASAAEASFETVTAFHPMLDHENLPDTRHKVDPADITLFLKSWIKHLGAISVGVTELQDYHMYGTIGRGDRYGEPVGLTHKFAIALSVEMDKNFLDRAPQAPTVMESAQQYLNAGIIAVQVAEFIRSLGYSTRAHIDGSYRVVCPLVARDAGLGEIGRMGLLMTPELGPRVRLAVVTTDLPLVVDVKKRDYTMIDFCRRCQKCANICPAQAIAFDDRRKIDGVLRWQINSEECYTFWCKIGTDCGRCMSVCPYSHPDTFLHNMVRFGIKRSHLFRKIEIKMDDFFYGSRPAPLDIPAWIRNIAVNKKV